MGSRAHKSSTRCSILALDRGLTAAPGELVKVTSITTLPVGACWLLAV